MAKPSIFVSCLLCCLLLSQPSFAARPFTVSTFESIGIYWVTSKSPIESGEVSCRV